MASQRRSSFWCGSLAFALAQDDGRVFVVKQQRVRDLVREGEAGLGRVPAAQRHGEAFRAIT